MKWTGRIMNYNNKGSIQQKKFNFMVKFSW